MSVWRIIFTDLGGRSGVAPICDNKYGYHNDEPGVYIALKEHNVYDCCPKPHLECTSPIAARIVSAVLTECDVRECD